MLHVICTRVCVGVGDGSRRSEEIVKISNCAFEWDYYYDYDDDVDVDDDDDDDDDNYYYKVQSYHHVTEQRMTRLCSVPE